MIDRAKHLQSRQPRQPQPHRLPLPISSGVNILPGTWGELADVDPGSRYGRTLSIRDVDVLGT